MRTKVMAYLRSVKEAGDPENGDTGHRMVEVIINTTETVIFDKYSNSAIVAEYKGNLYRGIFNIFNFSFYIDDVDGYIGKAEKNE